MNEYDDDDNPNDNIKCKKCDRPIKNALDNRSLDFLCNLVGLNEKKKPGKCLTLCCSVGDMWVTDSL